MEIKTSCSSIYLHILEDSCKITHSSCYIDIHKPIPIAMHTPPKKSISKLLKYYCMCHAYEIRLGPITVEWWEFSVRSWPFLIEPSLEQQSPLSLLLNLAIDIGYLLKLDSTTCPTEIYDVWRNKSSPLQPSASLQCISSRPSVGSFDASSSHLDTETVSFSVYLIFAYQLFITSCFRYLVSKCRYLLCEVSGAWVAIKTSHISQSLISELPYMLLLAQDSSCKERPEQRKNDCPVCTYQKQRNING